MAKWCAVMLVALALGGLRPGGALQLVQSSQRLAIERAGQTVRLRPSPGEPTFAAAAAGVRCVINRHDGDHGGGFKLTMPPWTRGDAAFMSGLVVPGRVISARELECNVPRVITSGNTTLALAAPANASADPRWAAASAEHFALFQPEFGRRPYVREDTAEIVAAVDASLFGQRLRIEAVVGGVAVRRTVTPAGPWLRLAFALAGVPRTLYEVVEIALTLPSGERVAHPRTFARAVAPELRAPANLSTQLPVVWQVDAAARALRADSTPVIANGWFSGGYDHEAAGVPPRALYPFGGSGQNMSSWLHTQ
jgi:hypothetical protein